MFSRLEKESSDIHSSEFKRKLIRKSLMLIESPFMPILHMVDIKQSRDPNLKVLKR